jgi:NCAIR mutase (PurE)-related protein
MDDEVEKVELDTRSNRFMKSKSAREHRTEVKEILMKKSYKEEKEMLALVEKHNNILEAKRNKKKRQAKKEVDESV